LYFVEDLAVDTSWIKWTGADLPTGNGLGVEINHDSLNRHKISITV
jgi:hypothetical protein